MGIVDVLDNSSTYHLECADVLDGLRQLPAGSVHCVCTSPPYWGLRDYGTGTWEGGDSGCDHLQEIAPDYEAVRRDARNVPYGPSLKQQIKQYKDTCAKCGARRIDKQIGSEPSPDCGTHGQAQCGRCYVCTMVAVMREVKRVLRDDGTLWLNLGSTYYSGSQPGRSRDTSGTGLSGCPGGDLSSPRLGDERPGSLLSGSEHSENRHAPLSGDGVSDQTQECTGNASPSPDSSDSESQQPNGQSSPATLAPGNSAPPAPELPRASRQSRRRQSSLPPRDASAREGTASASPLSKQTSSAGVQESVHTTACTPGTFRPDGVLDDHSQDTEPSCTALETSVKEIKGQTYPDCTITVPRYKPGDMVPIPWLVAIALQQDGWILRQDIIWSKPSPMPESVQNRCTKAHEYIFLLVKKMGYFWDAEAIKEVGEGYGRSNWSQPQFKNGDTAINHGSKHLTGVKKTNTPTFEGNRNKRSVWTVAAQGYPGAHFATYPPKLIEPCILAGTSARGCCPGCGAPWQRVVEDMEPVKQRGAGASLISQKVARHDTCGPNSMLRTGMVAGKQTVDWQPTCTCNLSDVVPGIVLDPFAGSGTTLAVALRHNCRALGIELNASYIQLAEQRIAKETPLALFQE